MNHKNIFRAVGSAAVVVATLASGLGAARADLTFPGTYYGTGATKYTIMNLGASAAAVSAAYYPEAGNTPDVTDSLNIANASGRLDVNVASVGGLAANWKGSVVLSSDQQVAAVAVTNYTGRDTRADAATSAPGTEMSAYEAALSGSTTMYFPSLFRLPLASTGSANQTSRLTVMNTTGSTAAYTISYVARDGAAVGNVTGNLNAYGSKTFQTGIDADMPANFITNMAGKNAGFSAKLSSDKALAALAETNAVNAQANWSADAMASSPAQAATKLYSPSAFRLCQSATPCLTPGTVVTNMIQFSAFQLQNTTGSTANVTADFVNRATGGISYTLAFTIPANAGYGINLWNGGSVTGAALTALYNAIGSSFAGSVVFNSDQALVGVGNLSYNLPSTVYNGSYSLVGSSDATGLVYAPLFNRQCSGYPTCPNAAAFQQFSAFQLMNVGASACNGVSIQILNGNGSINTTLSLKKDGNPINLTAGGAVGLNSFNGGDFNVSQFDANVGGAFAGSIKVNAPGCQLKAVVETRNGTTGFDQYNAFNQ
ncbi:MAG: hypothetical protein KA750_04840 [Thermoflexales bacterium]|nr:hypothetical protein [Thermoflexales bacterium]MBP8240956.1 hypothetical protein [Thermoflexales bacterium]